MNKRLFSVPLLASIVLIILVTSQLDIVASSARSRPATRTRGSSLLIESTPNPSEPNQAIVISGRLVSGSQGLGYRDVRIDSSVDGRIWGVVAWTKTKRDGLFVLLWTPPQPNLLYIRAYFPGDRQYSNSFSNTILQRISSPMSGYVYVWDGKFHESNGNPIYFFGNNYWYTYDFGTFPYPSESETKAFAKYGSNFQRIWVNWRYLEPTFGLWNETYLSLLDHAIDWCEESGQYVLLDMHVYEPFSTPTFLDIKDWWNSTFQGKLQEVWTMLANRYARRTVVLGYDVPSNEPPYPKNMTYANCLLPEWRNWLQKRYSSINELNNYWNHSARDKLDPNEVSWDTIKLPASVRANEYVYWDESRGYDWTLFLSEKYYNITQDIIAAIKAVDTNHLFFFTGLPAVEAGFIWSRQTYAWNVPADIDVYAAHVYCNNWGDGTSRYSNQIYTIINSYRYLGLPIFITETGKLTRDDPIPKTINAELSQAYEAGVQGLALCCMWVHNGELHTGYEDVPRFANAFRQETPTYAPKVAIIQTANNFPQVYQLGEALHDLQVPYQVISDIWVSGQNKNSLANNWDVLIFPTLYAVSDSFPVVKNFGGVEGKYVLYLGSLVSDADGHTYKRRTVSPHTWAARLSIYRDLFLAGDYNWIVDMEATTYIMHIVNDFGDLSAGSSMSYASVGVDATFTSGGSCLLADRAVVVGKEPVNNYSMLVYNGGQAWCGEAWAKEGNPTSWSSIVSEDKKTIIRAFLSWTGVITSPRSSVIGAYALPADYLNITAWTSDFLNFVAFTSWGSTSARSPSGLTVVRSLILRCGVSLCRYGADILSEDLDNSATSSGVALVHMTNN